MMPLVAVLAVVAFVWVGYAIAIALRDIVVELHSLVEAVRRLDRAVEKRKLVTEVHSPAPAIIDDEPRS